MGLPFPAMRRREGEAGDETGLDAPLPQSCCFTACDVILPLRGMHRVEHFLGRGAWPL